LPVRWFYNDNNSCNFKSNIIMGIIKFLISLFTNHNKIENNLKEWDSNFKKGKIKKGRRFR